MGQVGQHHEVSWTYVCVAHPSVSNRCLGWQKVARKVWQACREGCVVHSGNTRGMWEVRGERCVAQPSGSNRCSGVKGSKRGAEVRSNKTH